MVHNDYIWSPKIDKHAMLTLLNSAKIINPKNMKAWSFRLVICLWKLCEQAFEQCETTLSTLGVMRISIEDTAAAAQVLSESFHVGLLNSSFHYMRVL